MPDGGAMTDKERAEASAWQGRAIGPNERLKTCAYCGHPYYWPCEANEHERCGNFQHFQHMRAATEFEGEKMTRPTTNFSTLIARAAMFPPLKTAVVCPEDRNSLGGVILSAEKGLIEPILVGNVTRILAAAGALEADISDLAIIAAPNPRAAASRAVEMVLAGRAGAIMKGDIHSDALLSEVVKKDGGLRTGRRLSHVFALGVPGRDEILYVSDAAINIAPDLATKVDITRNAIDLARACGCVGPNVAVLSAVETVNPNIPSTVDAAELRSMAGRDQFHGALVDGPFAMDNAVDVDAARTKGIASPVAGRADILIVPNIEAGNILVKSLVFLAKAQTAGIVMGAKAPIILTSRADNPRARLTSCALAQLHQHIAFEGRRAA